MVDLRLWPATPNSPQVAFHMDLLDIVHAAMMECQVSLHHASNMLWFLAMTESVSQQKTNASMCMYYTCTCLYMSMCDDLYTCRGRNVNGRTNSF